MMFSEIIKNFINNFYNNKLDKSIISQLMEYEDFINEDNLIVMCINCHKKEHYPN